MITLLLRENTVANDIDKLIARISNPGRGQTRAIAGSVRQRFAENFTREGSGAGTWRPLAPMTVAIRRHLGFGGAHPILVRTGNYRDSFTNPQNVNHYENIERSVAGLIISVGSDDPRGPEMEQGAGRVPARPVTILDDLQAEAIANTIDYVILQLEHEVLR